MFNYWVWEEPSWRVAGSYATRLEALKAAKNAADPPDSYCVCKAGSDRDISILANGTDRFAPFVLG